MSFCLKQLIVFTTFLSAITLSASQENKDKDTTIVELDGTAYLPFDLNQLQPVFLLRGVFERFTIDFVTNRPTGLIWLQIYKGIKMYVAMENGLLIFVCKEDGQPDIDVSLGRESGVRFDDQKWHNFIVERKENNLTITIDGSHKKEVVSPNMIQFLIGSKVFVGGAKDVPEETAQRIDTNFRGALKNVEYYSEVRSGSIINNVLSLIMEVKKSRQGVKLKHTHGTDGTYKFETTPAPDPVVDEVTFVIKGAYFTLPEIFSPSPGDTLEFKFHTTTPEAIIFHCANSQNGYKSITMELFDGNLYIVLIDGNEVKRVLLKSNCADGIEHQVSLKFNKNSIGVSVDEESERINMPRKSLSKQSFPQEYGLLYFGALPKMADLPWHTWARQGYQGCLNLVLLDGTKVNLRPLILSQERLGSIVAKCTPVNLQCTKNYCVNGGRCLNLYNERTCECIYTDYLGPQCSLPAPTALFNGRNNHKLSFRPQQSFHTDKISFRFKAMTSNGLIFHTHARNNDDYMRAEIEDGKLLLITEFDGNKEELYIGNRLNDGLWHTVEINRRADSLDVSIDNSTNVGRALRGENFFHIFDDVFIGGYDMKALVDRFGNPAYFIGYLRNFMMGEFNIIDELHRNGDPDIYTHPNIPKLIFYDVTFSTYDSHIGLEALKSLRNGALSMMIKTYDESGIIAFASGWRQTNRGKRQSEKWRSFLLIEMFSGRIFVKLQGPSGVPLITRTPGTYNDGQWHSLTIVFSQDQMMVSVDQSSVTHGYSDLNRMSLDGDLYLGGIPSSFLNDPKMENIATARHGFLGCLASVVHNGDGVLLFNVGAQLGVLDRCQDIKTKCTKDTCHNGGICYDHLHNGTTWCDCKRTAFAGLFCADEPLGYYIRSEGDPTKYGMLQYSYPQNKQKSSSEDFIVFGVMTDEKDRLLLRLDSAVLKDFFELKLLNGYVSAFYNTNSRGQATSITNTDVMVADGKYHVVTFHRKADKATLTVDGKNADINHLNSHDSFNNLGKISVGGLLLENGEVDKSTGFRGIIGGLYVNGDLIFPWVEKNINTIKVKDAVIAPHPFKLGPLKNISTEEVWVTKKPVIPEVPVTNPSNVPVPLPDNVGGGGIAIIESPGGIGVVLYPDGSGAASSDMALGGPAVAEGVAAASLVPIISVKGARAGALMGIILGTMIFLSSLMWAFYLCKPGCCGAGANEPPLIVSSPSDAVPLVPIEDEQTAAVSKGRLPMNDPFGQREMETKLISSGGGDLDNVDFGGHHASSNNLHNVNHSTHNSTHNLNVIRTNHMSTQNITNVSSHNVNNINAMNSNRSQFGSRQHISRLGSEVGSQHSGYGSQVGYRGNTHNYNTGTRAHLLSSSRSYQADGTSTTADYDIAIGVHQPQPYKTSTLPVGRVGLSKGYSTSTIGSNYNYTMKSTRSIGANSVFGPSIPNIIITPGPMGEEVRVDCCLMSSDGRSVVTGSSLGPPQVWNMADGELLRIMAGETVGSTFLHLVCNENLLIGATEADLEVNQYSVPKGVHNYKFQIWDFITGRPLDQTKPEICSALCLMSDSDKVVLGRTDNFGAGTTIVIWDLIANQAIKEMRYDAPVGNNDFLSAIYLSQNDRFVVAAYTNSFNNQAEFVVFDMTLTSFNITDPYIMRLDTSPDCLAVLPNDEVACGLRNGDLVIWSLRGSETFRQLMSYNTGMAHSGEVKAVTCSHNSHYLVSASVDNTLKVWDLHTEKLLGTLNGHKDEVWCVAISRDNELIVSGSRDGNIRMWKLRTAMEICTFNAGVDVFHICVSDDKSTIVGLGDKYGARKLIMLQVVRSKVKKHILA